MQNLMQLTIDTGVREYQVNGGGCLRFNPADPNLYHRFFEAQKTLADYDEELNRQAEALKEGDTAAVMALVMAYDGKIKALLNEIFGPENNFDTLLSGVNLAAVGTNGKRVVQNLLEALTPILREGAEENLRAAGDEAVREAQQQRENRAEPARPA